MKDTGKNIQYKASGGIFDLLDNVVKEKLNITDEELDFFCEKMTDEELNSLLVITDFKKKPTFPEMRKCLEVRKKYLDQMQNEKNTKQATQ